MKKLYFLLFTFSLMLFSFTSCDSNGNNGQVIVNQSQPNIGENLDLRGLGEVVKNSRNPQEIEQKLNTDDGINNLDLDGDGNRDYLKVTEYGQGTEHGYSVCAVLKDGEPEVANVVINTSSNQMSLNGNPSYYGDNNNTYHSTFSNTDLLILAWMMQPHYSYYHSPYHYGYYGYGYGLRPVVSHHSYNSRPTIRTIHTTKNYTASRPSSHLIKSPNYNNSSSVASKRALSFSKPSFSQKSFKVNNNTSKRTVSGFGNKSNNSSYKSTSNSSASKSNSSYNSRSSGSGFGSSSKSNSSSSKSRSSGFGSSSKSSSSRRR